MRPWEGAEMQDQETLYRRPRWRGAEMQKKTYLPIPAQMEPPPPMRPWEGAEMQDQETLYRRPRWRGAEMQDQAPLYQPPRREIFPWDVDKYRQQGIAPYDLWR
jgi:hypothetical protein